MSDWQTKFNADLMRPNNARRARARAQVELKPCPSCGSTQIHDGTRGMTVASKRVQCLQCGMQAPSRDTWNRRATPAWESVTGNVRLHDAAQVASEWLRWWLDRNECECEDVHTCGKAKRHAELRELEAALNATEPTDLDRAWAWFRESGATLREYPHGAYWAVMLDGNQIGSGLTKDAAVLAAWRASQERGQG